MSRKFRNRNRQIRKLGLRTILVASAIAACGLMTATLLMINFFRDEKSMADSNPMVVSEIEVFQNPEPVLRGSTMQCLLGVKVVVKGNTKKLQLSTFEFTSMGTSLPIERTITNARLWSTGFQDFYAPIRQLGAALPSIPEGSFPMIAGIALNEGENYFWLTCDIGDKISGKGQQINAGLLSAVIGTLTYEPDRVTGPTGKMILNNLPYYSRNNGDISSITSWNSLRDGSGKNPQSFNDPNATFCIQPGHILSNTLNACLPALLIERNGVLQSTSSLRADYIDIQAGGTFIQQKEMINPMGLGLFIIRNNGNYIQLNAGALPGKEKRFEKHATVTLNNYNSKTFAQPVTWGNLIIDSKASNTTDFGNCFQNIKGDLEIKATGAEGYLYTTSNDTIKIGGSLYVKGGRLILTPGSNKLVMKVTKDFILDKGWFSDLLPGKGGKGTLSLQAGSLLYLKSGNFKMMGNESEICFIQPKAIYRQSDAVVSLPNVTIQNSCTLNISGSKMGTLQKGHQLTIKKDAVLNTGVAVLDGEGLFLVDEYATLSTENREGINSMGPNGCIQTAKRYYSSKANYVYTGALSPQYSGIFSTNPETDAVNNLIVSKSQITDVLVLQQPILITGRLIQQRGNINKNSFLLEQGIKKEIAIGAR